MTTETKCTNCGTINVGELMRCRMCNHPLHLSEAEIRKCPQCNSIETPIGEEKCISCGWDFSTTHKPPEKAAPDVKPAECEYPEEAELHTVRSFGVELAVIFMLLAGGLGIMHALLAALPNTSNEILSNYGRIIPAGTFLNDVLKDHVYISVLMFVFGALSIGLSVTALRRSNYAGAVAGAVFGILSIGFLFGAFFGLAALVLLLISKREFLLECT